MNIRNGENRGNSKNTIIAVRTKIINEGKNSSI